MFMMRAGLPEFSPVRVAFANFGAVARQATIVSCLMAGCGWRGITELGARRLPGSFNQLFDWGIPVVAKTDGPVLCPLAAFAAAPFLLAVVAPPMELPPVRAPEVDRQG
jgi:hypothetical protein